MASASCPRFTVKYKQKRAGSTSRNSAAAVSIRTTALDLLPLGVIKINPAGYFTYANQVMMDLVGVSSWEGLHLKAVFPDRASYARVKNHLKKRLTVQPADAYEIELTGKDRKKVPIEVSAFQDIDAENRVVGAVAIVRDLTVGRVAMRIHQVIAREQDSQIVLGAVAREIACLVPFERLSVSLFSSDGQHVRRLYSNARGNEMTDTRWYKLYPNEIEKYKKEPTEVGDPEKLLARPEWAHRKNDPTTLEFLRLGFRSSLRYTVIREGNPIGALHLFSKPEGVHTEQHVALLRALPISEAVLMVIHYEEVQHLRFVLDLVNDLSSVSSDIRSVADKLGQRIGEHYQWNHVSILRVDEDRHELRVLSQWATADYQLSAARSLPLDHGLLGYAYKHQRIVNVGDVNASPKFKDIYRRTFPQTKSELCLPVTVQGKVNWLINVEDSRKNAFVTDEEGQLTVILKQVASLLERAWSEHYISAVFRSARDALILTTDGGIIKRVNPAASELLGYGADEKDGVVGRSLTQYIKSKLVAKRFWRADAPPSDEVTFLRRSGEPISALVSSAPLPSEIGGRIIVASDLSWRRRLERLETLRKIYAELASQTKPPLSLVFAWLKRMQSRPIGEWPETIEKTLKQLTKLDLTFTRLMLYEREGRSIPYNERPWDLPRIVESVLERLPTQEAAAVTLQVEGEPPPILGDYFQLTFCVESVLSYLSRLLPQNERISLSIYSTAKSVALTLSASLLESLAGTGGEAKEGDGWLGRSLGEMALGLEAIRAMMERNRGRCFEPRCSAGTLTFRFEFRMAPHR